MDTSRVRNSTRVLTSGIKAAAQAGATAQALFAGLRCDGRLKFVDDINDGLIAIAAS